MSIAKNADNRPPALIVGDLLPEVVLPDNDGKLFNFRHQSIAGETHVFWLFDEEGNSPPVETLVDCAGRLAAFDARLFIISVRPLGGALTESFAPLRDPEGKLFKAIGIAGTGLLVVNPRGRIVAVLDGNRFERAIAIATDIFKSSACVVRQPGAPVLIVPDILDKADCGRLIDYWQVSDKVTDTVSSNRGAKDTRLQVKKRADVMIADQGLFNHLKSRLMSRLIPEMKRAFDFDAASFEALRVGCYDSARGDFFKRHRDNSTPYTAHRSFAMSLNLNPQDYEGGQVCFPEFGRELYSADQGGAVVFSCNLLHEALPVTRGRRFAVFTFLANAAGAERERKLIEREAAAGRKGTKIG
ncbi:MAG: 2OG-Fe(II) oxygenase [Geminicoccaceae bacterium]|nr:2OG-Fe(II) oxygenase [Geminicoccaceae bacterium]